MVNMNKRYHKLKLRLKSTQDWIENFLEVERHRSISKRARRALNKDNSTFFKESQKSSLRKSRILIDFIKMMNKKYNDIFYVFHSTAEFNNFTQEKLINEDLKNCGSISDEKIKSEILKSSIFAVAKSGTISLEI